MEDEFLSPIDKLSTLLGTTKRANLYSVEALRRCWTRPRVAGRGITVVHFVEISRDTEIKRDHERQRERESKTEELKERFS